MSAIAEESPSEVESEIIGRRKIEPSNSESDPSSFESEGSKNEGSPDLSLSTDPAGSASASASCSESDSG